MPVISGWNNLIINAGMIKTNKSLLIIFFIMVVTMACSNQEPVKTETEKPVNPAEEWFKAGEWRQGWEISSDATVNREEFYRRYQANPERWNQAFSFLATNDLAALEPGRHELQGEELFANVDEYQPRELEDTRYEAHQKYADIQYLVKGTEKIGVLPIQKTTVTEPYDEENDIAFMTSEKDNLRLASPDTFFIFFPEDAHRPCVKNEESSDVRKVVVKVRIN